jgi:hypothetical protein
VAKLTNNEKPVFLLVQGQGGQNGRVGKTMLTLSVSELMHSLTISGLTLSLADEQLKVCGEIGKLTTSQKQALSQHKDTIKLLLQPVVEEVEASDRSETITVCIGKPICDECGGRWLDITSQGYRCTICNSETTLTPDEIFWAVEPKQVDGQEPA